MQHIDNGLEGIAAAAPIIKDELKAKNEVSTGVWESMFFARPHSNNENRLLLPAAIAAVEACQMENWPDTSGILQPVLQWLWGQKHNIFHYGPISDELDILFALQNCRRQAIDGDSYTTSQSLRPTLKDMLRELMIIQQNYLAAIEDCKNQDGYVGTTRE